MPDNVVNCSASLVNPSDPLCERMKGLLDSGAIFCAFRNWAFNPGGTDISDELQAMILGPAEGDLLGSTWPNLIIAPGVVTSAKMTPTGVTPGVYSNPTVEVDVAGRIVVIADGAAPAFGANEQVDGSGSNFVHSGGITWSNVVFGVTDPVIVLPASGTYLLTAIIGGFSTVPGAGTVRGRFYNVTGATAIANSGREIGVNSVDKYQLTLSNIVTVGAATITIQVASMGAFGNLNVEPLETSISYVRLA